MPELRVTGLYAYPIKSCRGVRLRHAEMTPTGIALDREFMLIDEDDDFLSQRKIPEMALVQTAIGADSISLSAPGMPDAEVPLAAPSDDAKLMMVTVHGKPVAGELVSTELDEWFTSFLPAHKRHRHYRLVRVRDDLPRYISERYRLPAASNRISFADGSAILLASERSLAQLNSEMDEAVPMDRFRPNVVIDGDQLEPYDEDYWTEVRIGALTAFVVKASDRCVIPDVNQNTAATGKAVRRALTGRRGINAYDETDKGVFFAQNLSFVYSAGVTINEGDAVDVVRRRDEPNVRLTGRAVGHEPRQ